MAQHKFTITDNIYNYQHGAEWMLGRSATLVEQYEEDGDKWGVFQLAVMGSLKLYRFPFWVMDATQVSEFMKTPDTTNVLEPTTPEAIPNTTNTIKIKKHVVRKAPDVNKSISDKPDRLKCKGVTAKGRACMGKVVAGSEYCVSHAKLKS
ncbi:MAG: hypothetical protein KAS32_16510 [Candidatus Peribacteraceae bacterium]|nr:hypothetical protein [Candidatus Peribacteraceae bacterium]